MSGIALKMRWYIRIEFLQHSTSGAHALLRRSINPATPPIRPVGIRKMHVSMTPTQSLKEASREVGRVETPRSLGELIFVPVVVYLQEEELVRHSPVLGTKLFLKIKNPQDAYKTSDFRSVVG